MSENAYALSRTGNEPFDTESAYRAALDEVLERADRLVYIFDRDLVRMQLDSAGRCAALRRFLAGGPGVRELRIVIHDPAPLTLRMPRLTALLRQFEHRIGVRLAPDECRHLADCHLLADGLHGVRRFHADWPRGVCVLDDADEIAAWWGRYDELWGLSSPLSLVTTTGLA